MLYNEGAGFVGPPGFIAKKGVGALFLSCRAGV